MIEKKQKIYEGKAYYFLTGIDEVTGEAPVRVEMDHLSERGMPQRAPLLELRVRCNAVGVPISVNTTFQRQQLDPLGGIVLTNEETHFTKKREVLELVGRLLQYLAPSVYNGFAAGGIEQDKELTMFLGQPDNRPFNPDGSFNDTAVDTPGTYDYHTTT